MSVQSRARRAAELSVVVAAFALNAVAHERWLLAAPLGGLLVVAVLLGWRIRHAGGRMLVAGAAVAVVGLGLAFFSPPPAGPIPPALLSPLGAGLMGLATFCGLSGNHRFAWVYAWLLAVLSANVSGSTPVLVCLGLLALATIVALFSSSRLTAAGGLATLAFGVFIVTTAGATWQLSRLIRGSEDWLMEVFSQLTTGVAVSSVNPLSVDLPQRVKAPLSTQPLLELEGVPPRYLRTGVLEVFDGRRWSALAQTQARRVPLPGGHGTPLAVTLLARLGGVLPTPAGVRSIEGVQARLNGGWTLEDDNVVAVTARLERGEELLPFEAPPSAADTSVPEEVAAQLAPLAGPIVGAQPTARGQAEALERHFRDGFEYSLDVDLSGEGHPLAVLVRERRPAFCTYFASAMVVLLRTRGIAARIVTGFAPGEPNGLTGRTTVRSRDAHAWVEAYLPEEGRWVGFDPTPWRSRDAALQVPHGRGLAAELLDAALQAMTRAWVRLRYTPGAALQAALTSPVLWGVVGLGALLTFGRRRLGRRVAAKAKRTSLPIDARLAAVYQRYLTLTKRLGLTRAPHETDDELLRRLRAAGNEEAARAAERFVAGFRRARFRGSEGEPLDEPLGALEVALNRGPAPEAPLTG